MPKILLIAIFLSYSFDNIPKANSLQPFLNTTLDFASSPIDVTNLVVLESHIVFQLLKIQEKCDTILVCPLDRVKLEGYIEDFELTLLKDVEIDRILFKNIFDRSIIDLQGFGYDASKHPFKIYRTLRRIVQMLPNLMNSSSGKTSVEVTEIQRILNIHQLPKQSDVETSIFNALRLNQIFKLSFIEFLQGKLGSIQTKVGLTSEHLVEMGKLAAENKMYSQAVDTFSIALWNAVKERNSWNISGTPSTLQNKSAEPSPDPIEEVKVNKPFYGDTVGNVSLREMYDLLQEAIRQHDEKVQGVIGIDDIYPESGPLFFDSLLHNISHPNFKYRTPVRLETIIPSTWDEADQRLQVIKNGYAFEKLCRGEEGRSPAQKASLKCYHSTKSHPEFILKPLRIEVHHEDPLLLQYHDVFTETEMGLYRQEVKGELRMSRTLRGVDNATKGVGVTSRHRTSSNAWIEDYFRQPVFKELLHKIGRYLRVDTFRITGSENMQIAAYSPGGHYVPHTDAVFEEEVIPTLDPSEFLRGDRISTFMLYLSDVEEGGGTAFPILDTFVSAKKGSAIMWYNLHPDGSIDRRTLHGGCSVIYGVKWIANKWIRSDDQFYTRKCPATKPIPNSWPLELHV